MPLYFPVKNSYEALNNRCEPFPVNFLRNKRPAHVFVPEIIVVAGHFVERVHFFPFFFPLLAYLYPSFSGAGEVVAVGEVEAESEVLLHFFKELLVQVLTCLGLKK